MKTTLLLILISFISLISCHSISQKGINLIKEFEGCILKAYQDSVGVWTIGYGTTSADKSITGTTIYEGLTITQETADSWLSLSVNNKYGKNVDSFDSIYHWNQNEFDALCSFAYNIGSINGLVNNGNRAKSEIPDKMLLYVNAGGQKLDGLVRRRKAEVDLYKNGISVSGGDSGQASNGKCSSGNGICITTDDCTKSGGSYVSGKCPNDPNNVKCCNKQCSYNGKQGECKFVDDCKNGNVYSGLCPGNNNFKCCIQTTTQVEKCSYNGNSGECKNPNNCNGQVISGLCSGGNDNKCCIVEKCSYNGKSGVCKNPNNCNGQVISGLCSGSNDNKCCIVENCSYNGKSGVCKNPNNCNGQVVSGLCSGGNDNKCCI